MMGVPTSNNAQLFVSQSITVFGKEFHRDHFLSLTNLHCETLCNPL